MGKKSPNSPNRSLHVWVQISGHVIGECIVQTRNSILLLGFVVPFVWAQSSTQLPSGNRVKVMETPPEAIPVGTCQKSYSGYLEVQDHGKIKDVKISTQQIGDYVKKRLGEGYSLSLYPQASGRVFIIETCEATAAQ
jgi:hypothetical protein